MIKESKYIIRRIIVAVGVILLMSFINSCKVKALSINDMQLLYSTSNNDNNINFEIYLDNSSNRYYFIDSNNINYNNYFSTIDYPFIVCGKQTNNLVVWCQLFNKQPYYYKLGEFSNSDLYSFTTLESSNYRTITYSFNNNNFTIYNQSTTSSINIENFGTAYQISDSYIQAYDYIDSSNVDLYNILDNSLVFQNNMIVSSPTPEFVSFNAIPITYNNVITSYTIQPEFTSFDSNSYVYQYSFDNNIWLSFSENQQLLRINNNSTIYVRIKDLANNEIIDTANLTISRIGTFYNEQDYEINFSGEARTSNDLNNNSSGKSSVIMNYQIYVDYKPKSSILTYQYQYVNSGSSLDNNNWENVSSSDNGSITYVASQNGVLYARILDKDNNILKTASFNVNSIGKLAIDNNTSGVGGLFDSISSKVNFNGPISSIINVPIQLITTISIGLGGGLTCTDYPIGSLWGTNLVIPCVNIKQHLGNSLYTTIDLIISCCMIYYIIKMFGEIYTNLLFMQKNPIQDLGKRGD